MIMQCAPFWKASLRNYQCGISCRLITDSRPADRKSVNKRTKGGVYSWTNLPGGNNRVLERWFNDIDNCVFLNIGEHDNLKRRIKEDLNREVIDGLTVIGRTNSLNKINQIQTKQIYHEIDIQILREMTSVLKEDEIKNASPLDSSGVYSNMYIDVARLFFEPEKHRYIVYRLINKIIENEKNIDNIDAFVSASRIGANLANIIGWLMGKKVIFCNNIGPKYSLTLQYLLQDIRPKKSTHIFLMSCALVQRQSY